MEEIDLKEIIKLVWSKKIAILAIVIVFMMLGLGYTKLIKKPEYKATSTLVLVKNNVEANETITQTEVTLNQKLVATYSELIKTNSVLRQVIQELGYSMSEDALRKNVSVKLVTNSQLIEIAVINANPEMAQNLTNEIVKVFIKKAQEMFKLNNINIIDEAKLPTTPYNINHIKDIIMFMIIGIIFSLFYVFVGMAFDTTIKSQEETEKKLGITVLAQLPQYDYDEKKKGKK